MNQLSVYDHLKAAEAVRKKRSEKRAKTWEAHWRKKASETRNAQETKENTPNGTP